MSLGEARSCHLLCSCGGEHGSDPESGGESGNWLCLGMKKIFSFYWTRLEDHNHQCWKWRGTTHYWQGSSANIAHHVCCPFLQEQCHLHIISCGPLPLCHTGRPEPHPFSPKSPFHNLLTSILLPTSRSSVTSRHSSDSQHTAHKGFKPHSLQTKG